MTPILWLISVAIRLSKQFFSNDPKSIADRDGVVRTNPTAIFIGNAAWTIHRILWVFAVAALLVLAGIVGLVWYQEQPAQKKAEAMEEWVAQNGSQLRQACNDAVHPGGAGIESFCSDWDYYEYQLVMGYRQVSWRDFTIPADTPKAKLFPCRAYVGISDRILCDPDPERKGTLSQAPQLASTSKPQVQSIQQADSAPIPTEQILVPPALPPPTQEVSVQVWMTGLAMSGDGLVKRVAGRSSLSNWGTRQNGEHYPAYVVGGTPLQTWLATYGSAHGTGTYGADWKLALYKSAYPSYESLAQDQKGLVQYFCSQGARIYQSSDENYESGDDVCVQPALVALAPVPSPVTSPVQSAPTSVVPAPGLSSSAQPQFVFHASSSENVVSPTQSGINNAPRLVLQCVKNGQRFSVGLFRIGNELWLYTYDSVTGLGTDFYTYAAFREQGLGDLFLDPGTFRVGNHHNVEAFNPMIVQACQSGMHIFADTGTGIVDACRTR